MISDYSNVLTTRFPGLVGSYWSLLHRPISNSWIRSLLFMWSFVRSNPHGTAFPNTRYVRELSLETNY